jgi:hypothetical protein
VDKEKNSTVALGAKSGSQEVRTLNGTASRYDERIGLTARGRLVPCFRKGRAGFTLRSCPYPARASGPCSQLSRRLGDAALIGIAERTRTSCHGFI